MSRSISSKALPEGTSTEDHLPLIDDLYVEALARYCLKLLADSKQTCPTFETLFESARAKFAESFAHGKVTRGVAEWAERVGQELTGLDSPPSKVGIAREYVSLLVDAPADRFTGAVLQRAKRLLELIQEMLGLPLLGAVEASILRSEASQEAPL